MKPFDLSPILEKSKELEYLVSTHDAAYDDLVDAVETVKQFIIEHKLIIYGGTAIDYALRLRGDKIYPDDLLKIPDLDFYSPDNVIHSYQLADILFKKGYPEARAINAQHMETMRVDLINNHWIADITYRPPEIFSRLPYLVYHGMRIIHPDFQRIDVHSSLSFPYDNPPREVIFERWSKDIKRFNKLAAHYPIMRPIGKTVLQQCVVTINPKYIFTGTIAYALVYREFVKIANNRGIKIPDDIVPAEVVFSDDNRRITFSSINRQAEFVSMNAPKMLAELATATGVKHYEPYINLLPERIECDYNGARVVIFSTKNKLITVNSIILMGTDLRLRITNIQYLLKYFISMHFVEAKSASSLLYISLYTSLLSMISTFTDDSLPLLLPSTTTYGDKNISLAREIAINRMGHEINGATLFTLPQNYYPGRSAKRGIGHPQFDPANIKFFQESGKEIKDNGQEVSDPARADIDN